MGMVIEGISTTQAAYELAQELGVYIPITQAIYQVIYHTEPILKMPFTTSWTMNLKQKMSGLNPLEKEFLWHQKLERQSSLPLDLELDFYQQPKHLLKRCCQLWTNQLSNLS